MYFKLPDRLGKFTHGTRAYFLVTHMAEGIFYVVLGLMNSGTGGEGA